MSNHVFSPPGHWTLKNVIESTLLSSLIDCYVVCSDNTLPFVSLSPLADISSQSNPFDLSRSESVLWKLIRSSKLISAIKNVSSYTRIRPIHYAVLVKPPGAPMTPWHRDRDYLPISSNVFTAWIPLTSIPSYASIHYAEDSSNVNPSFTKVDSSHSLDSILSRFGNKIVSGGDMNPGDIDIHDGHTWHYAPRNTSPEYRVSLGIAFVSDGTCIELCPPGFDSVISLPIKIQTLSRYFPGLVDGNIIAGPFNPLL